jgi:PAS domain-containing protein
MLGYPLEAWEAEGLFWTTLLHPDDKERVIAENARANAAGEALTLEYRMLSRDGRVVWVPTSRSCCATRPTGPCTGRACSST